MPHAPAPPAPPRRALEVWCDRYPAVSETFVAGEARALAALGHPVRIVAATRGDAGQDAGVPASYVWEESTPQRLLAMAAVATRHPWRCLGDLRDRRRWRADEDVPPLRTLAPGIRRVARSGALVHAHFATAPALRAMRTARIAGVPWTMTAHAYDIYQQPANLPEKLRSAALTTSGCAYTVADLRAMAGSDAAARVHEIVMGVDAGRFVREHPAPAGRHVVAVGRLVEKKGFADLLSALAEPALDDVTLTLVGDGPLAGSLREQVAGLGTSARVTFAGAVGPEGVREQLSLADVLAMPCVVASDGDRDSMPVVVKEAMAMEVPVVVSDAVGLPELVTPECGRVVTAGDPAALARGIAEVLAADPAGRAAMGAAGRARVLTVADVHAETARLSALLQALGGGTDARPVGATSRSRTD